MRFAFSSFSCLGPRQRNEDRLLLPADAGPAHVTAIADGVGGAVGGAEAAEIAVECATLLTGDPAELSGIFSESVRRIKRFSEANAEYADMATTLSVALLVDDTVYVAHVGDTRIYHLRGPGLNNLTSDQTEFAELERRGVLSPAQLKRYRRKNVLISALSSSDDYEIHYSQAKILPGDRLLLLTDGVYDRVLRGGVLNLSLRNADIEAFLGDLRDRVEESGPRDNYSAIGIEFKE